MSEGKYPNRGFGAGLNESSSEMCEPLKMGSSLDSSCGSHSGVLTEVFSISIFPYKIEIISTFRIVGFQG